MIGEANEEGGGEEIVEGEDGGGEVEKRGGIGAGVGDGGKSG